MRILTNEEIKRLSVEDRDILRNEIFADHGYKFKTEKWINYFENKDWYHPRFDNVDNLLTAIEKANIDNISKYK